ncbi:MAG: hypothetical protein MK101_03115 [Phycisphaerales bacterium]|nr:hypothetical protein [Phycisphaerales bacterium]
MRISLGLAALVVGVMVVSGARAEVFTVAQDGSGDFTSINDALLEASYFGYEVHVKPGVYEEHAGYQQAFALPAGARLISTDGPESTVLSGGGVRTVISFKSNAQPEAEALVRGFTIKEGWRGSGGGVRCQARTLLVENCTIEGNYAWSTGGAGHVADGGDLTFLECTFQDNSCQVGMGAWGVSSDAYSQARLESCTACNNGGDQAFSSNVDLDGMTTVWEECGDCNGNGESDDDDYINGLLTDLNENGLWDQCEGDCNNNNVADPMECAVGYSPDINGNYIPDSCEDDCDGDGLPDSYELEIGTDQDCDGNGIADACDILDGLHEDCDSNGVPDSCESLWQDCNENDLNDFCEMSDGGDCNENDIPDVCEIADGLIDDINANEIDDECECLADIDESGWVYYEEVLQWLQWHGQDGTPADVDASGHVDILDLIYILSHWGQCPN